MENKLELLKSQLPKTEGEERLDLLVQIVGIMFKSRLPELEDYYKKTFTLAKELKKAIYKRSTVL